MTNFSQAKIQQSFDLDSWIFDSFVLFTRFLIGFIKLSNYNARTLFATFSVNF